MGRYDFDLFVIGAGSGGVRAARMSSSLGARVAIAEERHFGGTCVNAGCIPKKLLAYGSHYRQEIEDAASYGWRTGEVTCDWGRMMENKDREIKRLSDIYKNLLQDAEVEVFEGTACLEGHHRVAVNGRSVRARHVLIAAGSWPTVPSIAGAELAITSNEAFHLEALPERVVIVGGGYIAVEFASIFAGFGAEVLLIYRGGLILRKFDLGLRRFVESELGKAGVSIRHGINVESIESVGTGKRVRFDDGWVTICDEVMFATGRLPLTESLGLQVVGVETGCRGEIPVNDKFATSNPSVLAIGDVIDVVQLTPVAIAEGMCVSHNLYGGADDGVDYRDIPTAVFSQPNLATVGLTEEEATRTGKPIHVYESSFRPLKLTITGNPERAYMKLVVDESTDRVLGVHMVGPDAGEIIQGAAIAMKAGATKSNFDRTFGIHPTTAEEIVTMRERVR